MKLSRPTGGDKLRARLATGLGSTANVTLKLLCFALFPLARTTDEPKKILVHLVGNVGDIVVATPMLIVLRQRFPEANIELLTSTGSGAVGAAELLAGVDFLDSITSYALDDLARPGKALSLIRALRANRPDLIVMAPPALARYRQLLRNAIFARALGARRAIGLSLPTIQWALRSQVRVRPFFPHETQRFLGLLAPLNWVGPAPKARIAAGPLPSCRVPPTPFVAICPGGKQVLHRWPEDRFREVVREIVAATPHDIVAVGTSDERELCQRVIEPAGIRGHNLAGQLGIGETTALLAYAQLVLTNDTGPMHLAAACAVPLVALFGGSAPPGRWFPLGGPAVVFRAESACRACLGRADSTHCITRIDVAPVTRAVLERLSRARPCAEGEAGTCYLPSLDVGDEPIALVSTERGWASIASRYSCAP